MFAYRATTGSAPLYLNSQLQTYVPSKSLSSVNEQCNVVPSQKGTKSLSQTFSWTVPCWWNDLPTQPELLSSRNGWIDFFLATLDPINTNTYYSISIKHFFFFTCYMHCAGLAGDWAQHLHIVVLLLHPSHLCLRIKCKCETAVCTLYVCNDGNCKELKLF